VYEITKQSIEKKIFPSPASHRSVVFSNSKTKAFILYINAQLHNENQKTWVEIETTHNGRKV